MYLLANPTKMLVGSLIKVLAAWGCMNPNNVRWDVSMLKFEFPATKNNNQINFLFHLIEFWNFQQLVDRIIFLGQVRHTPYFVDSK